MVFNLLYSYTKGHAVCNALQLFYCSRLFISLRLGLLKICRFHISCTRLWVCTGWGFWYPELNALPFLYKRRYWHFFFVYLSWYRVILCYMQYIMIQWMVAEKLSFLSRGYDPVLPLICDKSNQFFGSYH